MIGSVYFLNKNITAANNAPKTIKTKIRIKIFTENNCLAIYLV